MITGLLTATCTTRDAEPINVSVRDVVIDPYAVDGKLVRLHGFLHQAPDGAALYWHEADIKQSIPSHAVGVQYSSPADSAAAPDGTFIVVEGIFHATKPPQRGWSSDTPSFAERYNGALADATRVQVR